MSQSAESLEANMNTGRNLKSKDVTRQIELKGGGLGSRVETDMPHYER
jgi:hypothetical protein